MPKIYYRTSYTAISTFYWESIIHLFSWKTWKLSVKLSWDLSITGQRRRRLGEWAIGLCCMWVIDWTINQSITHTVWKHDVASVTGLLYRCIVRSTSICATTAEKLEGTWRGMDADPLPFLPLFLFRLPLLLHPCFTHSLPYTLLSFSP